MASGHKFLVKAADQSAKPLRIGLASHQVILDASPWLEIAACRVYRKCIEFRLEARRLCRSSWSSLRGGSLFAKTWPSFSVSFHQLGYAQSTALH